MHATVLPSGQSVGAPSKQSMVQSLDPGTPLPSHASVQDAPSRQATTHGALAHRIAQVLLPPQLQVGDAAGLAPQSALHVDFD